MELKLVLPGITYNKIKPGQMFTDKFAKKLFVMSNEKIEGVDEFYKAIEIFEEGFSILNEVCYQNVINMNTIRRVKYKENSIFEMFNHTTNTRQIFNEDFFYLIHRDGVLDSFI